MDDKQTGGVDDGAGSAGRSDGGHAVSARHTPSRSTITWAFGRSGIQRADLLQFNIMAVGGTHRSAPTSSAPDRVRPFRFLPATTHSRRSRTLSLTALAWPMVLPTKARSHRLGYARPASGHLRRHAVWRADAMQPPSNTHRPAVVSVQIVAGGEDSLETPRSLRLAQNVINVCVRTAFCPT